MTVRRPGPHTVIVVGIGTLIAFILGLYSYVRLSATPIHPDPLKVTSVPRAQPEQQWATAVEQGRQIARAAVSEQNLPGLSVAVGAGGRIVWPEGFGWSADVAARSPVKRAGACRARLR